MLKWLSLFDWYTPIIGLVTDAMHGPVEGYSIPAELVSTWELRRLLRAKGVKPLGVDMQANNIFFTVPRDRAGIADATLTANGIPFTSRGGRGTWRG